MKIQERARKKAAELEAKFIAAKVADVIEAAGPGQGSDASVPKAPEKENGRSTELEASNLINSAIKAAKTSEIVPSGHTDEYGSGAIAPRPPFRKASSRTDGDRSGVSAPHEAAQVKRPPHSSVSDRAESWRAKPRPPMLPVQNSKNDISYDPALVTLPAVRAFELDADESMEVIDFNDMGRLIDERGSTKLSVAGVIAPSSKHERPIASDFFGEPPAEKDYWRRASTIPNKSYSAAAEAGLSDVSHEGHPRFVPDAKVGQNAIDDIASTRANVQAPFKVPASPTVGTTASSAQTTHLSGSPANARLLRSPNSSYREAPLSALDDTMSRIKGALDGMHSVTEQGNKTNTNVYGNASQPQATTSNQPAQVSIPSKPEKWLPPALRPPGIDFKHKRTETFEYTRPEAPQSPAPPGNDYVVRLPMDSRCFEPLTKKQLTSFKHIGPVRWDILSFDPPVEGMTKRSLLVNDVLFRRPPGLYKSRKYRVFLPKPRVDNVQRPIKANAPVEGTLMAGSNEQPKSTSSGSWRAISMNSTAGPSSDTVLSSVQSAATGLDVTSRSPPPDVASTAKPVVSSEAVNKNRIPHKTLDGTNVTFSRDIRKQSDGTPGLPMVTFTVGSELEGETGSLPSQSPSPIPPKVGTSLNGGNSEVLPTHLSPLPHSEAIVSLSISSRPSDQARVSDETLGEQSDLFSLRQPKTPPPQNTQSSWSKSPARAPDPEHLKAVWSQTSDKDGLPTVNSLKGIADDLTSVPFTLQEVKSEDGGTPPPSGPAAPPTRMSASEVTRAFQTVPSGSSTIMHSSTLRSNEVPPNLGSPLGSQRTLKPTSIGLPPPAMNPNASRPQYMGSYPPMMNNHTPSPPTLVYSHVMPNGMGSPAASPYAQPVWMPMVQQGPQILRPQPSSPYSPSLMPYHIHGVQNGMFPHSNGMPNTQGSPASYPSAPPPQMMVSPVLPHASPAPHMVYGSPMLVHVPPPGGAPQPRTYPGVVGMGRGSIPMDSRTHPSAPTAPSVRFPSNNSGYTSVPSQSFVRPW